MKKISYIIPVYNAQDYLQRCIESIINGIGKNEEIILVDDGSTDLSGEICNQYSQKYECIKVIHQENAGGCVARNEGIKQSQGEWIVFVDADDFVDEEYHKFLIEELDSSFDILLFDYIQDDGHSAFRNQDNLTKDSIIISGNDIVKLIEGCFKGKVDFVESNGFNPRSAWAKAFRSQFLKENRIEFPQNVFIGEDRDFVIECYSRTNSIKYIHKVIYHYFFLNTTSITNRYKPNLVDNTIASRKAIEEWLNEFPRYKADYESCILDRLIMHIRDDFFHPENQMSSKEKRKHIEKVIEDGKYKESYNIAIKSGKIKNYSFMKRVVFWATVNKKYQLILFIYKMRYKGGVVNKIV